MSFADGDREVAADDLRACPEIFWNNSVGWELLLDAFGLLLVWLWLQSACLSARCRESGKRGLPRGRLFSLPSEAGSTFHMLPHFAPHPPGLGGEAKRTPSAALGAGVVVQGVPQDAVGLELNVVGLVVGHKAVGVCAHAQVELHLPEWKVVTDASSFLLGLLAGHALRQCIRMNLHPYSHQRDAAECLRGTPFKPPASLEKPYMRKQLKLAWFTIG